MKNFKIVPVVLVVLMYACLMQACDTSVGGNEDRNKPVVTITGVVDANDNDGEIIGDAMIQWVTDEANRSTVDISLSGDSGVTYDTVIVINAPDTGEYLWDTNTVADCTACRIRITATDVVGNVSDSADSDTDFIINNTPQVIGSALFRDIGNDGPSDGDTITVVFDKNVELLASSADSVFLLPVVGDEISSFATVNLGLDANQLIITINDLAGESLHLHVAGKYRADRTNRTAPSGLNIFDNLSTGVVFAPDTGRSVAAVEGGIDIGMAFEDDGATGLNIVVTGDFNGDGFADGLHDPSSIGSGTEVWLNDGTGHFSGPVNTMDVGSEESFGYAVGDIDNDGDLDVVMGNGVLSGGGGFSYVSAPTRVWKNNGSGSFTNTSSIDTGAIAGRVVLKDVNKDNNLDIIMDTVTDTVVYLNNGSGAFSDSGNLLAGFTEFALADIDGDGDNDIVSIVDGPDRIYKNNGSGIFSDSGNVIGNGDTSSLVLGDIDGDGDIDIVSSESGDAVHIYLNSGSGSYAEAGFTLGDGTAWVTAVADIDRDGNADLFDSNGTVWSGDVVNGYSILLDSVAGKLVDLDNDADLDILGNNIYFNSTRFVGQPVFLDTQRPIGGDETVSAYGDVDGDGDIDAVGGIGDNSGISQAGVLWLNDGRGLFIEKSRALPYGSLYTLIDIDNDGDLDLVVHDADIDGDGRADDDTTTIWKNDGQGVFADTGQLLPGIDIIDVQVTDVTGNKRPDILVAVNGAPNKVWFNNGSGVFTDSGQTLGNSLSQALVLGDIDNDGDKDMIEAINASLAVIWENNGSGQFSNAATIPGAFLNYPMALADLDGDGFLDMVAEGVVYINNAAGPGATNFTVRAQPQTLAVTGSPALADLDKDGDADLVVRNEIWLNDGAAHFTIKNDMQWTAGIIELVDIDGDNDLDACIYAGASNGNRVMLNDF